MKSLIYILFLLSGFVALIYEGLWTRYLKLFLGHSSYGQVITLITFMGGIGLGSFLAAKYLKRVQNPFRTYAMIEFAVSISALVFHFAYGLLTQFFFDHAGVFGDVVWLGKAVQVLICFSLTLPFATLLGMTYPLIAAGMMRLTGDGGRRTLPILYFINSLGGAVGILATSYFFIAHFGTNGTLLLAGLGNALVGLGFFLISRQTEGEDEALEDSNIRKEARAAGLSQTPIPSSTIRLWLAVSLGTGFASFIYEVGWIRLLSLIMGSSTHSFDVMISAFIFGLAFGGLFAARLLGKPGANITKTMATVQILMGCFAVMSIFLYRPLFEAIRDSHSLIMKTEEAFPLYSIYKYCLALGLMFPASFCAGITLPLITYFLVNRTGSERYTGLVYGWNTIGSIAGAAIGGLFLLPLLQLKWTIFTGAALDVLLGLALLKSIKPSIHFVPQKAWACALAVVGACMLPAIFVKFDQTILTRGFYRHPNPADKDHVILEVRDGRTASISATQTGNFYSMVTNGKSDGAIMKQLPETPNGIKRDESTVAQLATLPMLTRTDPYNAAVIGMGTGMTLHYLLSDERLEAVDLIEIEPVVIDLAKHFRPRNERCYTDERVNFVIDDAKSYFYGKGNQYDIIISEPSNPWVSGVASLFTREFYQHSKTFLKPGGVFVQWVHGYEFRDDLMVSILAALTEFNEFEVYRVHEGPGDYVILASDSEIVFQAPELLEKHSDLDDDLAVFGVKCSDLGPVNFMVSSKTLGVVLEECQSMANSDYFPYVEQHAETAFFMRKTVGIFDEYSDSFSRFGELFDPQREALFRNVKKSDVIPGIGSSSQAKLVRDSVRGASRDSDWENLESGIMELTGHHFFTGRWHDMEIIREFFAKLESEEASPNVVARMTFLKALSEGNGENIQSGLARVLQTSRAEELITGRWRRTITVNLAKFGSTEQLDQWSQILSHQARISPYERSILTTSINFGKFLRTQSGENLISKVK